MLALGWAAASVWDATARGARPHVFWRPLVNKSHVCDALGALDSDGTVRCVDACPVGVQPLGWYCPTHDALTHARVGAWAADDDALAAVATQLLHGALVGAGVALSFNTVLCACAPLVVFGAAYGAVGGLALLGARLLAAGPVAQRVVAWGCLGAAALGMAMLAALHGALATAAVVLQRASGRVAACVAAAALLVPLCAAAQALALVGGLYAALALLASDATVAPVPWTLVGREVAPHSRAAVDRATAALAIGLWGATLARHAALLAFAVPAARRAAARVHRAPGRPCATGAASLAATAGVATAAWAALAAVRYVARRTTTLRDVGGHVARPLLRVCECLATTCAASLYLAFPMVYAAVAVFDVGAWGGARRVGALTAGQPMLFAVAAAVMRLVEALRIVTAAAVAVGSAVALGEAAEPQLLVLRAAVAGLVAHAVTAPTAASVNVGVLEHAAARTHADAYDLFPDATPLERDVPLDECATPSLPGAAETSDTAAGA